MDFGGRKVCVIGLPLKLASRFKAAAQRANTKLNLIFSELGSTGFFALIPHEDAAVHELRTYADNLGEYSDAVVLVLPYTPLPKALKDELQTLSDDCAATVIQPTVGVHGWPKIKDGRVDAVFLQNLFDVLISTHFPAGIPIEVMPSIKFLELARRQSRVIIPDGALADCDLVAKHRYKFMRTVSGAVEQFLAEGAGGRLDAFFGRFGLQHAQTGGIVASLTLKRALQVIHQGSTQTHLKQGDATTRFSAARVYYYLFSLNSVAHVSILYAGPHPISNVSWSHDLS